MKSAIVLFLLLACTGCASDRMTVRATVIYIEPFPFATQLGHQAAEYKQAAWIKRLGVLDSLAILFDYRTSAGDDIQKKISVGKTYEFTLIRHEMSPAGTSAGNVSPSDSIGKTLRSSPTKALVDNHMLVKAKQFWMVLKYEP